MISIIISTHKPEIFKIFSENLNNTIGVEYELISIENNAQYSISEAYNMGIEKSSFSFLCFVHEDVLFKTQNWGKHLISIMENDPTVGLIGVAGSKFKSTYPLSGWGQGSRLNKYKRGHIFHKINNKEESYLNFDINPDSKDVEEVVCLDGVFLFSKKEVFENCRFDDKMLTDFHGYDADISLQVFFQNYKVLVDRGIELIHFSGGNYSTEYTIANKKIWRKWILKLPVATNDLNLSRFELYKTDAVNWYYSGIDSIKRKLHIL